MDKTGGEGKKKKMSRRARKYKKQRRNIENGTGKHGDQNRGGERSVK